MMRLPIFCVAAVVIGGVSWIAPAADPPHADKEPFLEDAHSYAMTSDNGATALKLREPSILNWTNPARLQERGSIYVWTDKQRPLAIGSFFTYQMPDGKVFKKHELHSLSTRPLEATYNGQKAWTPDQPGVTWTAMKDAPKPGSTHVNRLLQMRQLARQFRAEMVDPKGDRNELRLAPRPLYEYASPETGVTDGVIFTFVVATDPEVLLLMEAIAPSGQEPSYRYGIARFHYWELAVYEGDKKVWTAELDKSHELNSLGDVENISKIYNSYHPRGNGVPEPTPEEVEDAQSIPKL